MIKPFQTLSARQLFLTVFVVTLLIKLWLAIAVPITGDEALFYWWGKYPDWGYYDHPPMIGWFLAVMLQVSDAVWWLRLPTVLLSSLIAYVLVWLLREQDEDRAYLAGALYLAMPISWAGVLFTTDTPMILFAVLSVFFTARALSRDRWVDWLLAGACLGLSFLSKYFAALLGVAYLVYFLIWRRDRFGKFLLLVLCSLPFAAINVYYNYTHCWSNIMFNVYNRNEMEVFTLRKPMTYLGMMLALLTPWLLAQFFVARRNWRQIFSQPRQMFLLAIVVVPYAIFLLLSAKKVIGLHWVMAFYPFWFASCAALIPLSSLRRSLFFSTLFSALFLIAFAVILAMPLSAWQKTGIYKKVVFNAWTADVVAAAKTPDRPLFGEAYTPAVLLSYYYGDYVPVFGPGRFHARQDDVLVDFRTYAGRNLRIFERNEPNPLKYTPYFSKVAIKPIEVHGAQFWLVDGDNFNYPAFRATVLQEAIDHYYKIPAWLPKGGCPFCERYNGPAMCLATPQS